MTRPRDPVERFWGHVDKRNESECWLWLASGNGIGYGKFYDGNQKVYAHRFAYELLVGPIPAGLSIDHLCRNPGCVNPAHLEPVTHAENMRRGDHRTNSASLRKTHCSNGHPYSEENTYRFPSGHRACRICRREWHLAAYAKTKAKATA